MCKCSFLYLFVCRSVWNLYIIVGYLWLTKPDKFEVIQSYLRSKVTSAEMSKAGTMPLSRCLLDFHEKGFRYPPYKFQKQVCSVWKKCTNCPKYSKLSEISIPNFLFGKFQSGPFRLWRSTNPMVGGGGTQTSLKSVSNIDELRARAIRRNPNESLKIYIWSFRRPYQ